MNSPYPDKYYSGLQKLLVIVLLFTITILDPKPAVSKTVVQSDPALVLTGVSSIADIAEARIDGVVNISSTKVVKTGEGQFSHPFFDDPFFRDFFDQRFFGIPKERRERSLGSGVIVSADGLILTNNHVVEKAEEIQVTLADKREFEAEIVGTDPKSDVAVIRLKDAPKDMTPVPIGNSGQLRLGDVVLAIGNPFGLDHTVTMGIVSAKGRANVGITDYEDFIQTDAAINPGNSGGALINLQGELVGINTAILSRSGGYQGVGFAIPSNMAKAVMDSLVKHGKVVRGWLGVVIQDLDKNLAAAMDLKDNSGVLISDVMDDSPAAKAKLKRGDVIVEVNNEKINSSGRLRNTIAAMGAGAKVTLSILRKGERKEFTLTLAELPDEFKGQTTFDKDEGVLGGMTVAPLSEVIREKFDINEKVTTGVVITQVDSGSAAEYAGLRPGDVIIEIDRQEVETVDDFKKLYKKSKGDLLLLLYRQNSTFYLVLRK